MAARNNSKNVASTTEVVAPTWAQAPKGKGKAYAFRMDTNRQAEAAGWKVEMKDRVSVFTRGDERVTVTYSEQDFVRKVEEAGQVRIKPTDADKWKRLNGRLGKPVRKAAAK